jgi:hypothetical protein
MQCRICDNLDNNSSITLYEQMYGTGEPFDYFTCGECGCLQIVHIPGDMSRHYPHHYYSFTPAVRNNRRPNLFRRMKYDYVFFRTGLLGRILAKLESESYKQYYCFQKVALNRASSILDVGCGSGRDLLKMQHFGFTSLKGVDPYISESINYGHGLTIDKK